jgi:FtsP/CotA-like multicopper oxidase with cupredoxin domain
MLLEKGEQRPSPIEAVQTKLLEGNIQTPVPRQTKTIAIEEDQRVGTRSDPKCANLGPHEYRRLFFGTPADNPDGFALATDVIMANGKIKPGSRTAMQSFNHEQTTVCLTAATLGKIPTKETWDLINLTSEDHNFHIHQTRFWLLSGGAKEPDRIDQAAVLQDNVPVPHAEKFAGCDGTLKSFDRKKCNPRRVKIHIPFTQIGDFVFHCHILEHEDGGMMARIRVQASPILH